MQQMTRSRWEKLTTAKNEVNEHDVKEEVTEVFNRKTTRRAVRPVSCTSVRNQTMDVHCAVAAVLVQQILYCI